MSKPDVTRKGGELTSVDVDVWLRATPSLPSDSPDIISFAAAVVGGVRDDVEKARRLYYAVRDRFRYDPYTIDLTPEGLSARRCLETGRGFCVTKSALLAAAARAVGLPSRVGYADVRNHLATGHLRALMGTDLFVYHGFTSLLLNGLWVKATPAFNLSLCDKFGVVPLEFDGRHDSLLHPLDKAGRRHMEYVTFRGEYDDVPVAEIIAAAQLAYPRLFSSGQSAVGGDFEAEAEAEN